MEQAAEFYKGKSVVVTGACGTVGSELVRQLLHDYEVEITCLDNNESQLFLMGQEYSACANARFKLADIRDKASLNGSFRGADIVFHAAAYKHVSLCEASPMEAVQTNIVGVNNIIQAASECDVEKVIFTSSDKAVNPTNVMGTSKLMGERLITAANVRHTRTIFASTRFGNVLGSRGSVIPVFARQIRDGGPLTLTDPGMTRFIMSITQAVRLIIDSCVLAKGGEVFVTKMPVINIADLAQTMVDELAPRFGHAPGDIAVHIIGAKPGEKLYEELVNQEEVRRTLELDRFYVVLPALSDAYRPTQYAYADSCDRLEQAYTSEDEARLTNGTILAFLKDNSILEHALQAL
ncbi:MAG: polysaccharide biosynthesis protein [Pseudomonadota bacterium]